MREWTYVRLVDDVLDVAVWLALLNLLLFSLLMFGFDVVGI